MAVASLLQEMVPPLFHRYSPPRFATRVEVDNSVSDFYTVVEVFTHDRPGLLYPHCPEDLRDGLEPLDGPNINKSGSGG